MKKFHCAWRLERLVVHLWQGDIVRLSAQEDFLGIWGSKSISAQVERDDERTGPILPVASVTTTATGDQFAVVFGTSFAGTHGPLYFPHEESEQFDPLQLVRDYVRRVLYQTVRKKQRSVAFPLLSEKLHELDLKMLFFYLFEEFASFAVKVRLKKRFDIWLVVKDEYLIPYITEAGVQAWVEQLPLFH